MPDVRDFEPHVALVGEGETEAVARAARGRAAAAAAGSCSRCDDEQAPATMDAARAARLLGRAVHAAIWPGANASSRAAGVS